MEAILLNPFNELEKSLLEWWLNGSAAGFNLEKGDHDKASAQPANYQLNMIIACFD